MSPIVTLLTDFGAGSGYPAQVKGVLLRLVPDVRLVDLSHEVPAYDVLAGALQLEACVRWFPPQAVHLAVVDPGVGTARRALAVVDPEGRRLVGPDNGLFTPFLGPGARVRQIVPGEAVPSPASATFHGRDLFAPAAALLASGTNPSALGPAMADPVRLEWPVARRRGRELAGITLAADSFGNLLTSVTAADLGGQEVVQAALDGRPVRWVRTFGEAERGELVAYLGSGGRVEVAEREGSAATALGGARGHEVRVVLAR
ncbi:MAG: SAM-dependent chlorinase/fluorinase [Anaeromyxobacteraceae bacterium]